MADVVTPSGVMVEMVYTFDAQRCENVYHVTRGTPATLAQLQSLATIFRNWENVTAKLQRIGTARHVLVVCKALDGPGSPVYEEPVVPEVTGTQGGSAQPSFVTVAVRHTTGLGGRSYRGRTYWIGLTSAGITPPHTLTSAYQSAITACFTTLRSSLTTAGWTMVVVSKYSGVDAFGRAIPRAAGVMTPITASQCGSSLDTQRHRKLPQAI